MVRHEVEQRPAGLGDRGLVEIHHHAFHHDADAIVRRPGRELVGERFVREVDRDPGERHQTGGRRQQAFLALDDRRLVELDPATGRHPERPGIEPGADHDGEPQRIALEAFAEHVVDDAMARDVDAVRVPLPGERFEEAPAILAHQPLGVPVADERIVVQGILHAHASAVERGVRHRIGHPALLRIFMSVGHASGRLATGPDRDPPTVQRPRRSPGKPSGRSSPRTAGTTI